MVVGVVTPRQDEFIERLRSQWFVLDKENFGSVTRARLERFVWNSYGYGSPDEGLPPSEALPVDVQVEVDAIIKGMCSMDSRIFAAPEALNLTSLQRLVEKTTSRLPSLQ